MYIHLSVLLDDLEVWAPGGVMESSPLPDRAFSGTRMAYRDQTDFRPDILYILPEESFPVAPPPEVYFMTCCPPPEGIPPEQLILLRWSGRPERLCAALSDCMVRLENWENQLNLSIIEGASEQELLDISDPFLYNPVILQDASFRYLAGSSEITQVDKYYQQLKEGLDPTSEVVMSLLHNRQSDSTFQYGTFSTGQSYHVAVGPTKKKYKEVYVDLELEGGNVISAHMCLSRRPLTDGILQRFGLFCDKLLKICRLRAGQRSEGGVAINDYIFGRLIAGDENALDVARCDGLVPEQPYLVAAVDAGATRAILKYINTALKGHRAFLYRQRIYIYVPVDLHSETALNSAARQESLLQHFGERYQVRLGLSGYYQQLAQVGQAVAQAQRILELSQRMPEEDAVDGAVFRYRDLALLDLADCYRQNNPVETFAPPSYLRIVEGDRRNHTNNCYVAQVYIQNGCSVAQTAKKLFMHKNSVLYRVERIKNLYGMDFSDRREKQLFLLACLCRSLEQNAPKPPASDT